MKLGSIIVYKGSGPLFGVLSRILKLFEWRWDRWGWHMAFISGHDGREWLVTEAVLGGVHQVPLSQSLGYDRGYRIYEWFPDGTIDQPRIDAWVKEHLGRPYDVQVYFWTMAFYLLRHFWNRRIPRLLDGTYSCWELVFELAEDMGQPIGSKYDMPLITDFLRATGEISGDIGRAKTLSVMKERIVT